MNEKFFELPEEKKMRIINAAIEVFSQNDYKHASTDEMAAKAEISKGLLFYYFHNKKELYLFVYNYTGELLKKKVVDAKFENTTDFFEILEHGAKCKTEILEKNPYIMDFALRAFFSQKEDVSEKLNEIIKKAMDETYIKYFRNIDAYKFKKGVDPKKIVQMLTWMADGYLHEKQRCNSPIVLEDFMREYRSWADMFKKIVYKEEYI